MSAAQLLRYDGDGVRFARLRRGDLICCAMRMGLGGEVIVRGRRRVDMDVAMIGKSLGKVMVEQRGEGGHQDSHQGEVRQ